MSLAEYNWPGNVRELASVVNVLVFEVESDIIQANQVRRKLNLPPRDFKDEVTIQEDPTPDPKKKPYPWSPANTPNSNTPP